MRPPIRLPDLNPEAIAELDALYRTTHDVRLRARAHIILLAAEQHLTSARDCQVHALRRPDGALLAQALSGRGHQGLGRYATAWSTRQGHRRVPREAVASRAAAARAAWSQPYSLWTLQRLADYMAEQTGIRVDPVTVREHLLAAGIVLSRPQHKITSPDPEYEVKKRRLKTSATT